MFRSTNSFAFFIAPIPDDILPAINSICLVILDQLGGARYFSTLDLASGYWQVPLREEDMEKTAFSVGADHYEFTVMPFGLTNAPATFQRMMGNLLKGIKGCLVFIDDIIIFSDTWEQHQRILDEVFRRVRAAGLKIKRDKCQFAQESVKFLGHIVSARGTEPDSSKVEAVRDFCDTDLPHRCSSVSWTGIVL